MAESKEKKKHTITHDFTGVPFDDDFPGKNNVVTLYDLTDKTAIVTGAAHGLGRQIALGLASCGANVVVADIDVPGSEETSNGVEELGCKALTLKVDVTQWPEVTQMVEKSMATFGKIDICFNIPGINIRKPILELTPEEFNQVIDVNLKGVFNCAKAVGEVMVKQQRGKMINMASILGICGAINQGAYAASKGAIIQLTKVLGLEWAESNVQVNALAPGYHMTVGPIAKQYTETPEGRKMVGDILAKIPQGRIAHSAEIIGPALFLASEASNFVTGSVLTPDGGWTAQ